MVLKAIGEGGNIDRLPAPSLDKIGKNARAYAKERHRRDTEARVEPLLNEDGSKVIGPDGRPVEKVLGPLTKPGVPVGRYFDVAGRRAEVQAGGHAAANRVLDEQARARAVQGHPSEFAVGGAHQWSQNIAYGGNGRTAGTTFLTGPTQGHHGSGPGSYASQIGLLPGMLPGGAMPGGGGQSQGFGDPGEGWGTGNYPQEFQRRPADYATAYQNAGPLARAVLAPGMLGQRAQQSKMRWQMAQDARRGLVRPVIGYRPEGGNINFSNQQFSQHGPPPPQGGGSPQPATNPFQTPGSPIPPGPQPQQPPPQQPGQNPHQPPPQSPQPSTTPFQPGGPTAPHGITAGGSPQPSTTPFQAPPSTNPFSGAPSTHGITAGGAMQSPPPTNPFPPPPPAGGRKKGPPPSANPFQT